MKSPSTTPHYFQVKGSHGTPDSVGEIYITMKKHYSARVFVCFEKCMQAVTLRKILNRITLYT